MGIDRLGSTFRVRSGEYGPTTEVLSREGLDRLVDDAINDLTVLKRDITPDNIREYVENNVRINVDVGRYLAPMASDLERLLEQTSLECRCSAHFGVDALDEADVPIFRP